MRAGNIEVISAYADFFGKNILHARDGIDAVALTWAAYDGRLDVVKLLLDAGAEIDMGGSANRTALSWAAMQGHQDIACYLLEKGADPACKDINGHDAAFIARQYGRNDIFNIIAAWPEKKRHQDELAAMQEEARAAETARRLENVRQQARKKNWSLRPK